LENFDVIHDYVKSMEAIALRLKEVKLEISQELIVLMTLMGLPSASNEGF